jgi:hypothetical protein
VTDLLPSPPVVGRAVPRLWTPPLRELTPATSYGFEVVDFAEEIGHPLLPWQQFAVIHGGELLEDGRPRFRIVVLLVSRQNGKTELPVVLSVYWQFRKRYPLILGTSTQLKYAKESWLKAVNLVRATRSLDVEHDPGRKWLRMTNGETESWTTPDTDGRVGRYLIAASNSEGGRSLTVHRGVADELRQHHSYDAWDAFEPACSPLDAQIWALSNAGDSRSVVLNDLQDSARDYITTGVGDPRLGLLEWSSPDDADPEDVDALLQANPRVGHGLDLEVLLAGAARAKRHGGDALNGFLTERMCVRVKVMNPAFPPALWKACLEPGELDDDRTRLAACWDITPDGQHASLSVAAVLDDGRVRVETVQEWTGPRAASLLERDIPAWVEKIRPKVVGWLPDGPAAAVGARLADRRRGGVAGWPPRGVKVTEIRGELTQVTMGLGKEIAGGTLVHSGQEMLDAQIEHAEKSWRGPVWVITRRGGGNSDAVYSVGGAVHLARTMPRRRGVSKRAHSA